MQKPGELGKTIKGFEHINRYWDKRLNIAAAKILPGECYVSSSGEMIVTVLGSCISACIRDTRLGVGGMNHFMLPVKSSGDNTQRNHLQYEELCYGNWAMEYLINEILKIGGKKDRLEVKLFGGGKVLAGFSNIDVGARNIQFVREFIERDKLTVASHDLGGDYPRKVLYFPDTGAVKMRRMHTTANDTIEKREREYIDSMSTKPSSGDVELF